ncbi:MAG TPA: tetratricopeptide repeat protein [Methylomirabilota bacterium]|nr:tetratricopeptide repeat protein [Methylomirabilota bacterium]
MLLASEAAYEGPRPSLITRVATWAVPVEIALVTAAVFLPILRADWVDWDDPINFLLNWDYRGLAWRHLRWMLTANVMGHWIPVTWLTLGADYVLWGMNPFGYHLTSLVLHAASTAVLYLVARRLLALAMPSASPVTNGLGAATAALFFGVHPLRVESVAWITERRDLTSGLFFLLTVLAYLKAHEQPPRVKKGWLAGAVALSALALASKSIVMGLPLALIILDLYPLGRLDPSPREWLRARARSVWLEKIPFLLVAGAAAVTAYVVQSRTGYLTDAEPAARIVMVIHNVWFHAWKTFVPLNLAPLYELPRSLNLLQSPYRFDAIGEVVVTVGVWLLRRRWPAGLAIWAFYLVMLAPVSGIVHTGNHLGADRNTYVPCVGFALLVGALATAIPIAWRRGVLRLPIAVVGVAAIVGWIGGLALATRAQTAVWRESETLWRYAIEVNSDCSICNHNLAVILSRRGDQAESKVFFDRALALRPDRSEFHGNYGLLLLKMGRRQEGLAELRYRLSHNPLDVGVRVNLGIALIEDGHTKEAIHELDEALRIRPDYVPALNALGRALLADHRFDPAQAAFERALAVHETDPVAHLGLARVYAARGDRAGARAQLAILRRIDPQLARTVEQEFQ